MSDVIFPEGIRTFPPHANAKPFVKGTIIITLNELIAFCKNNPSYLTDYNGNKQLKLSLLESKGDARKLNLTVDTYKPEGNTRVDDDRPAVNGNVDDEPLPF